MWKYSHVTRQEFELIKDKIEKFIISLGGNEILVELPYEQKITSCFGRYTIVNFSTRPIFEYNEEYYRVSEVCFPDKPFIVIECGTYDELMKNIMDDAEPFPYDLTDDELLDEVKYSLGIRAYPKEY